jgi:tRNA guanosine-2'-O-methyltransferase
MATDNSTYCSAEHARSRESAPIIVVASLVDKAPNLGGLARTCEIFRAAKLVVSDVSVASSREFQGVSMTAEQWLPLEGVPEAQLPGWLQVR